MSSQNITRRRRSSDGNKSSPKNEVTNDNNQVNDDFESFKMKHRASNTFVNTRRTSLIPSQMIHANENKIPNRSERKMSQDSDHKMRPEYHLKAKPMNEEKYNSKNELKNSQTIGESRETLSAIGIEHTNRHRRGSTKTYSEISSTFNRDQRKNTALKYVNLYDISIINKNKLLKHFIF